MVETLKNFPAHEIIKKPGAYLKELAGLTSLISIEQNKKMSALLPKCGPKHFDDEGRVEVNSFGEESGGLYKKETVQADLEKANKIEESFFPDVNLETVQAYYKGRAGREDLTAEEIKREIKKERALRESNIAEIAINAVFNKVLSKKNLVVARTAKLDDMENGIDTFIFNPETGEIICGFDEVNYNDENEIRADSPDRKAKKESADKKKEKVRRIANQGGARLKYAYRLAKDESGEKTVKQGSVENLPVLYLGISKRDLETLLAGMNYNNSEEANEVEQIIFNKIVSSIGEQLEMFNKEADIPKPVRKNLNKLPDFLKKLKE